MICHEDALMKCFMFPLRENVSFLLQYLSTSYLEFGNPIFFKKNGKPLREHISREFFLKKNSMGKFRDKKIY